MDNVWQRIYNSALHFLVLQDTEATFQLVVKEALSLVDADYGSIFLVENDVPVRVYSSYSKLNNVKARPGGKIHFAFKNDTSIIIGSPAKSDHPELKELGVKSGIIIPLVYGSITIGVLSILSQEENLGQEQLEVLNLFAPLATLAVRKAYLSEELTKALEVRDLFMSLAAHELKTPLTIISAYNDSLLKTLNDTKQIKYSIKIKSASDKMKNLINEFLQVDMGNKGELQYNFKMTEIYTLVKKAVDSFIKINSNHRFIFNPSTKRVFVKIDPEKIIEVIYNFLNNAVKFSPEGSEIVIELEFAKNEFVLSVSDQGDGISKKYIKKIFEKFEKGSSKKGGMGLGLYLSKEIIEDHKGRIEIQSELGKGTRILAHIPLK